MPATQVLIVGAGPTGLVLALRLAHHGVPFRIIDRASGPGQASRATVVQARTLEFYQQLGLADAIVARGIRMEALHMREDGEEVATLSFKDLGTGLTRFPFVLCFPQDDHERFLVEQLEAAGGTVEWNTELRTFTQDHAGVQATIGRTDVEGKDGAETTCEAAWLCGCDGAHSLVRHGLGLDFPGGTYQQLFYVADAGIAGGVADAGSANGVANAGSAGGQRTDIFVNLGARGLALMFPVRSSGQQRLIGTVPEEFAGKADLTFEDIRAPVEALLSIRVEQVNWFSAYHVHHRVASGFRVGRTFLAGDAGHVHSPAGGQGMNTGIGDAVNLAWKLAEVIHGRAAPAILDTYETERIGFARMLVETTDRAFRGMVGKGQAGRFLRTWLVPHLLPLLTGFPAVRRGLFNTVSQLRIGYPDSALSEGRALSESQVGSIAAGDRLPWIETAEGDNFTPLDGRSWRLQLHGTASPALAEAAAALGLAIDRFAWGEAADRAGFGRDAAYLVRPDGHVALATAEQDPQRLRAYAAKHGLRFQPAG